MDLRKSPDNSRHYSHIPSHLIAMNGKKCYDVFRKSELLFERNKEREVEIMSNLIVDFALAASAQAQMVKAIQAYQEATEAVKAASDEIASQWEGDAKEAFVENETNAYNFYVGIREVAYGGAEAVRKLVDQYIEAEAQSKITVSR